MTDPVRAYWLTESQRRKLGVAIWVCAIGSMFVVLIDVWVDNLTWHKIALTWMILTLPVVVFSLVFGGSGRRE